MRTCCLKFSSDPVHVRAWWPIGQFWPGVYVAVSAYASRFLQLVPDQWGEIICHVDVSESMIDLHSPYGFGLQQSSHAMVFFSRNKSANSIFQPGFSAKRIGLPKLRVRQLLERTETRTHTHSLHQHRT